MPPNDYREPEPPREAKEVYERWLAYLDREIGKHEKPELRGELVLDALHNLQLGAPKGGRLNFNLNSELAFNVLQLSLDPKNVTLEAEYDEEVDGEKYATVKPLIWFWRMFDRSPVGLNHWLGFRFRAMLGKYIFKHIGENVRIFHGVEFTFGYNVTLEDDCVIRRYAFLDDRGELVIKKGKVIEDYATASSQDAADGESGGNRE